MLEAQLSGATGLPGTRRQLLEVLKRRGEARAEELAEALSVTVSGVPHRSRWPVYLTLAFAVAIALWGAWVASSGLTDDKQLAARRRELEARRSRGLAALAALDAQRRDGAVDEARYGQRRAQLFDQLERVYGELDGGGDLPGGGQGLAA